MNEPLSRRLGDHPSRAAPSGGQGTSANLADILERVLEKGLVIAGDIQINLLDIELLTIKLRLLIASVDKAKEMGIDWWEHDPALSSRASDGYRSLAEENRRLRAELAAARGRPAGDELPPGDTAERPGEAGADEEAENVRANERAAVTRQAGQAGQTKRAKAAEPTPAEPTPAEPTPAEPTPAEPARPKDRPANRGRRSVSGNPGTSGTSGTSGSSGRARTSGTARKRAEPRPRGKKRDEP
ncbi:gas vesicle protein GvpJ [Streptomyces sp. NPDC001633]|uniref:gas vesicle protein GvpJ n=1 Tax=Streptomyces sp. NPDC001633 TaxID=3364595 RepID=UPI0036AD27D2